MSAYEIAVVSGDGVGPEVVAEAVKVLKALGSPFPDLKLAFEEHPAGARCYVERGTDLPDETLEACRRADAVLFGSAGDPEIRFEDGTEIAPQLTSATLRPVFPKGLYFFILSGSNLSELKPVFIRLPLAFLVKPNPIKPEVITVRKFRRLRLLICVLLIFS